VTSASEDATFTEGNGGKEKAMKENIAKQKTKHNCMHS